VFCQYTQREEKDRENNGNRWGSSQKVCTERKCNEENEIKMDEVKNQQGAIEVGILKVDTTKLRLPPCTNSED